MPAETPRRPRRRRYRPWPVEILAARSARSRSAPALGEPAGWRIREVGDGNLNLVFIVEGEAGGVVVKQALPYVRMVGEFLAAAAGALMVRIQCADRQGAASRLTPRVFHFDARQAMIVMEYLTPHIIMRQRSRFAASNIRGSPPTSPSSSPRRCSRVRARRAPPNTRRGSRCSRTIPRCARSPRTWCSPIPIARRRSTAGTGPGSTRTSAHSSATPR